MIILSVLIPTLTSRIEQFTNLMLQLEHQKSNLSIDHPSLGEVEILYDNSKSFLDNGISIGAKRQLLLDRSQGKYVCFLDDDDQASPNYLETLVRLCQPTDMRAFGGDLYEVDCVTFNAIFKCDTYWTILNMDLNNENEETAPGKIVKRSPWHISAIKADIAKTCRFKDISHGEDWSFMSEVIPKLKTQIHTDMILTEYIHSEKGSEADKIIKSQFENRNVGNYSK